MARTTRPPLNLLVSTFWTVAYWNYLLKRLQDTAFPQFPALQPEYDVARDSLLEAAVVNIKKSGGTPSSDHEDLRTHVQRDGDLIKRQCEICRPDVVVCGNTWAIVEHLWPQRSRRYDLVWEIERSCIAVDFAHPALRVLQRMPYYALGALVAIAGCPGEAL